MKRHRVLAWAALALVATAGVATGAEVSVSLTSSGPQPATVAATLGDTITFVNVDAVTHTVTSRSAGIASPAIPPGGAFTHVLAQAGDHTIVQTGGPRTQGRLVVDRGSMTLQPTPTSVAYGKSVRLNGTTSVLGHPVTIQRAVLKGRVWTDVATVTPAPDGTFSSLVRPERGTQYRASLLAGELLAAPVVVSVKPVLTIRATPKRAKTGSWITVIVRMSPRNATSTMDLRQFTSSGGEWRRVATRPVRSDGVARFRWQITEGRSLLRAWPRQNLLKRNGYAPAFSRQILVIGEGPPPAKNKRR